jgi:hypothetical protein
MSNEEFPGLPHTVQAITNRLTLIDNEALRAAVRKYLSFLRHSYLGFNIKSGYDGGDYWTNDKPGGNVVRLVHVNNQRSSHSFIVLRDFEKGGKQWKQGDILMAAGWKTPAWNKARGNVMTGNYGGSSWTGAGYLT